MGGAIGGEQRAVGEQHPALLTTAAVGLVARCAPSVGRRVEDRSMPVDCVAEEESSICNNRAGSVTDVGPGGAGAVLRRIDLGPRVGDRVVDLAPVGVVGNVTNIWFA